MAIYQFILNILSRGIYILWAPNTFLIPKQYLDMLITGALEASICVISQTCLNIAVH